MTYDFAGWEAIRKECEGAGTDSHPSAPSPQAERVVAKIKREAEMHARIDRFMEGIKHIAHGGHYDSRI